MFILDFNFFIMIGLYLQKVLPHEYGIRLPWYFLCSREYCCNRRKKKYRTFEDYSFTGFDHNFGDFGYRDTKRDIIREEDDYEEITDDDILEIRGIVKIFKDNRVIKGINLNVRKDEIFVLLGFNDSGKTTLISVLTGLYESEMGKVVYNDKNILFPLNMDKFREKLGICPQENILFEELTIRENLEIFSTIKGVSENDLKETINKTLNDFILIDIQNILVKDLSSVNRRKLSIAISLIGKSEVIFLDEPTIGMDVISKRNIYEILKSKKMKKYIFVATRNIEEAIILGDRIGIIRKGIMKDNDKTNLLSLIKKYGKFMSLNITKENDADINAIIDFIMSLYENIQYEVFPEEIRFRIPIKNDNKKSNPVKILDIPKFFKLI